MRFFCLLSLCLLCLTGCAETGRLLGKITMLPVKIVKGAVTYQDGEVDEYDSTERPLSTID